MDVITPDFVGPFSTCTIGWKNGIHDLKRVPRHFLPSTHYASLPRQFCLLSFKHEFSLDTQGIIQKVEYIRGSNMQHSAVKKKKETIFALFLLP